MLAIYAPYIETTITFEQEVPSREAFSLRIADVQREYPWIVWEENGKILGYAYAHKFAVRISYRPSAELSVYLSPDARKRHWPEALRSAFRALTAAKRQVGLWYRHNAESQKRGHAPYARLFAGLDAP